ncbi:MAG: InlB B-repeat-containing protein, partial [Clostridiales bacterium]|nr:InlB B-repeat-containing protein [Clostridiales bacterium]
MKKTKLFAVLVAVVLALCCALVGCNKTFTVTFESNGGSSVASVQVDKDGKVTKPTNPNKEGYNFVAWFKDEALTQEWKFDTDTVTGDITLYAKWEAKQVTPEVTKYTVTFNTNGGNAIDSAQVDKDGKVTRPADPTKTDFNFVGWYKDEALTLEWDFDTDTVTGDITLYAKWEAKQVTPEVTKYTVTFETNGGNTIDSVKVDKDGKVTRPTDPEKEGYTFDAWYKDEALTEAWDFDTDTVTEDITLYAKWTEVKEPLVIDFSGYENTYADTKGIEADVVITTNSITWGDAVIEPVKLEDNEFWPISFLCYIDGNYARIMIKETELRITGIKEDTGYVDYTKYNLTFNVKKPIELDFSDYIGTFTSGGYDNIEVTADSLTWGNTVVEPKTILSETAYPISFIANVGDAQYRFR